MLRGMATTTYYADEISVTDENTPADEDTDTAEDTDTDQDTEADEEADRNTDADHHARQADGQAARAAARHPRARRRTVRPRTKA